MNSIRLRRYIPWLLLLCMTQLHAATFSAKVAQTQLKAGESFELILESTDNTTFSPPDLAPLKPLFKLLSSKQASHISSTTGTELTITQWVLSLLPKQSGTLTIPALNLGTQQSAPITLYIQEPSTHSITPLEPVYIDTQLDQDWVYIQAQAVLRLRIYHAIPLFADSNLTPLLLDNARVEQLGKARTFEQHINGVRHGVIEISYAIFPQQSGTLEIPAQTFSATLAGHNPYSLTPFSAQPGQRITVKSARVPLQVKAIPTHYPKDALWLPAQQLSLSQDWTPDLQAPIYAGSALTRLLKLEAQGLPSSQLPELPAEMSTHYHLYADQPSLNHRYSEQGLLSSRNQRQALIFQVPGLYSIAAIQVPWWNTQTEQVEYAELPEQLLKISPQPLQHNTFDSSHLDPYLSFNPQHIRFWQLLSAFFILLSLMGFTLWWRARHQPAVIVSSNQSQRNLLDDLKRACLANEPASTRQALDTWARQHPESLVDMAARDPQLSDALDELNNALYGEAYSHWQGQALWLAIQQLPLNQPDNSQTDAQLPPLYPP